MNAQEKRDRLEYLTTEVFVKNELGKELLECWCEHYLKAPIWSVNCPESTAVYRAGQNDFIIAIINFIEKQKNKEELAAEKYVLTVE